MLGTIDFVLVCRVRSVSISSRKLGTANFSLIPVLEGSAIAHVIYPLYQLWLDLCSTSMLAEVDCIVESLCLIILALLQAYLRLSIQSPSGTTIP